MLHNRGLSDIALLSMGITVILLSLLILILLLWLGWFLLFLSSSDSVVASITKIPGNVVDKFYFVGFTLFTLGTGDFAPNGYIWKILTPMATLNGLFIVTFSITYLIPVIQAAVQRRSLAVFISSLGNSPEEIIDHFWNGKNLDSLLNELSELSKEFATLEQRHKAYPVLHYLHSLEKKESLSLGLSRLNEVLIIILHAARHDIMKKEKIIIFRRNIDYFLETLKEAFIKPANSLPPLPQLKKIKNNIDFYDQQSFEENLKDKAESDRRLLLYGFVMAEGREWKHIYR
jgi:hypothetical protein